MGRAKFSMEWLLGGLSSEEIADALDRAGQATSGTRAEREKRFCRYAETRPTADVLRHFPADFLREACEESGHPSAGRKAELIETLAGLLDGRAIEPTSATAGARPSRRFDDQADRRIEPTPADARPERAASSGAAIYGRESTPREAQPRAIDAQLARLREYAAARDFQLEEAHIYTDTESGGTDQRAGYQALRMAARARAIDVVIATRLDRIVRSVGEFVSFVEELGTLGVDIVILDQNLDTTTSSGRLLFHHLSALAKFDRDLVRDRVQRGIEAARARGKTIGRPSPQIDLAQVRALLAEGKSLREVAKLISATVNGRRVAVSRTLLSRRLREEGEERNARIS